MISLDPKLVLESNELVDQLGLLVLEEVFDSVDLVEERVHPFNGQILSEHYLVISLVRLHVGQVFLVEVGDQFLEILSIPTEVVRPLKWVRGCDLGAIFTRCDLSEVLITAWNWHKTRLLLYATAGD